MGGDRKKENADVTEKEDIRVGYQAAVDFWTYQGQLNWNRFSVMLVANSVIIAVIGAIFSGQHAPPHITMALCVVGLILCIAWVLLTARGFDHHTFWMLCAWELEEQLGDAVKLVSNLYSFNSGNEVTFNRATETKQHRLGRLSKVSSQRWPAYIVIGLVAVVYIAVLIYSIRVILHIA